LAMVKTWVSDKMPFDPTKIHWTPPESMYTKYWSLLIVGPICTGQTDPFITFFGRPLPISLG
jgi:hypothetical protein